MVSFLTRGERQAFRSSPVPVAQSGIIAAGNRVGVKTGGFVAQEKTTHDLVEFMKQVSVEMASEYKRIRARTSEDSGTAGDQGAENWASIFKGLGHLKYVSSSISSDNFNLPRICPTCPTPDVFVRSANSLITVSDRAPAIFVMGLMAPTRANRFGASTNIKTHITAPMTLLLTARPVLAIILGPPSLLRCAIRAATSK